MMNVNTPNPKPFTRLITTPPAFPWDQQGAALLEARHTSPISGSSSALAPKIIVRRLSVWKPGESGRFVAVYLRPNDALSTPEIEVEVQGKVIRIDLNAKARLIDQLRQNSLPVAAVTVMALCFMVQIGMTWQRRIEADQSLTETETRMTRYERETKAMARAKADAQALSELDLKPQKVVQVIRDLKTVTAAKQPQSRIDSFLWDRGYWAIEARGTDVPILAANTPLKRSVKPVRPGVWLWVASPEPSPDSRAEAQR